MPRRTPDYEGLFERILGGRENLDWAVNRGLWEEFYTRRFIDRTGYLSASQDALMEEYRQTFLQVLMENGIRPERPSGAYLGYHDFRDMSTGRFISKSSVWGLLREIIP